MSVPVQHNPSTFQFTRLCGKVITFAHKSETYPMLVNQDYPAPRLVAGDCPLCGQRHWKGSTKPW